MAFPIPASGLSVVSSKFESLRLFYQQPGGSIDQISHIDDKWSLDVLPFRAVPLTPLASTAWDNGEEIRVYYLNSDYIVQEQCYTEHKGWYPGQVGQLKVKATPLSRLSAIVYSDLEGQHIRVYYQESGTHAIKELCHDAGHWHMGEMQIRDSVEGTGIAAVTYAADGFVQLRVYYQTFEELYLKEYCHNNRGWFHGAFAPGKAPLGTTIGAVASNNNNIAVFWRRPDGEVAYTKRGATRWSYPKSISEVDPGFGFTALQWEAGKYLRLYCEDFKNMLTEYYTNDGGETWHVGKKFNPGTM